MRRLLLISATTWVLLVLSAVKGQEQSCESLGTTNHTAYIGWPMLFELNDVLDSCGPIYDDFSWKIQSEMRYVGSNESLYDSGIFNILDDEYPKLTYQINITYDTPDILMTVQAVNTSVCCTLRKNLKKEILKNETCEAASMNTTNIRETSLSEGEVNVFTCEVLDASGSPYIDMKPYDVTWYYKCNGSLPEGAAVTDDGKLVVGKVNHSRHPGLYSCSIVHGGQIRFVQHQQVCVAPVLQSSQVGVKCEQPKYYVDEGETANVTCNVDITDEPSVQPRYQLTFYPLFENETQDESKDNISCSASIGGNWTHAPDKRASCIGSIVTSSSQAGYKCFSSAPNETEWQKESDKKITHLTMTYRLENVKSNEFGLFRARAVKRGTTDDGISIFQISLKSNADQTAIIVGCVLGAVFSLLLIILACYYCRLKIRYHWKRSRCVPYAKTTDVKKFGAYLTYYWNNEEGMQDENPHYDTLINKVNVQLSKLNCPVYDPGYEPHLFLWNVKNIKEVQPMCDRVIVILSGRYIEKDENDFDLYTNFLDSTFIFIKVPGFDKALKNLDKKRRCALEAQLRRNYAIKWDGKEDLSEKFKMKLELAMPKRRAQKQTMHYDNVNEAIYENNI